MKKVLFGITSLTLGGAERVLVDLANALCDKYEITILTIYAKGELEQQLSSKVHLKRIYPVSYTELSPFQKKIVKPLAMMFQKRAIYQKKVKENYDVEIAFLEGPMTRLLSVKNKKVKKIAWVHNDISCVFGQGIKAKLKKIFDKKVYRNYKEIVFVSKDNKKSFEKVYPDLRDKYLQPIEKPVIFNYIDKTPILEKAKLVCEEKFGEETINFVTVARLVEQKGIDRLIRIHSKLIKDGLNHSIYVIGDGPEKSKLQRLVQENKVQDTFHLLGKKENPYPYIKQADYFCLLSYFEGYGMVLEEAKILNKPVLITDTAAREAVEKYENSQIVDNSEEGIYETFKQIIQKGKKKLQKEYISKEYDNQKNLDKVIKLVGE